MNWFRKLSQLTPLGPNAVIPKTYNCGYKEDRDVKSAKCILTEARRIHTERMKSLVLLQEQEKSEEIEPLLPLPCGKDVSSVVESESLFL